MRNIEKLKKQLEKAIEIHGRDSPVVLAISKKLDIYIVEEMKRVYKYQNRLDM